MKNNYKSIMQKKLIHHKIRIFVLFVTFYIIFGFISAEAQGQVNIGNSFLFVDKNGNILSSCPSYQYKYFTKSNDTMFAVISGTYATLPHTEKLIMYATDSFKWYYWNGSAIAPFGGSSSSSPSTTYSAGAGLLLTGTTFSNAAPDQTVSLSNGTGISASGTYPNFTITNTAPDQTVSITDGTGISHSGTYPNFTITNSAPDQTVSISDGTGISHSGTYPNFTITNTAPAVAYSAGTGLTLSGSTFSHTAHTGDATGAAALSVVALQGRSVLSTAPTTNNVLTWNGSAWLPSAPTGSAYAAGSGLSLTSGTFANTAPDQTVTLNNGTGISTSGTYPTFTITNSAPDQTVTLANGTGITTSGTYPSFTITNALPDQTVAFTNGTGISVSGIYPNFTITNTGAGAIYAAGTGLSLTTNTFAINMVAGTGITISANTISAVPFVAELVVSGDKATAANTTPVTLGVSFNYAANSGYAVDFYMKVVPSAATTGCCFLIDVSTAVTDVSTLGYHQLATTGTVTAFSSLGDAGATAIGVTSGMPTTLGGMVCGSGSIITGVNTGTATFFFRSETTAVTTCKSGSMIRIRKIY